MTEADVEHATLEWLAALGWEVGHGPDGSPPDARTPGTERDTYRETALKHRLQGAIRRLNPHIPASAQDEACRQVLNPNLPGLVQANRQMHRWMVEGVPVEYQKNGETRGDRVRLVDWSDVARNDWLALNQFSIQGPKRTRRPDVVLFLNGLPAPGGVVPVADLCRYLAGLGLTLIVEHIDDEAKLARIFGFGALYGQGQLFGGPRLLKAEVARAASAIASAHGHAAA